MKKIVALIFILLIINQSKTIAQAIPKHEMRAAWIATIGNIDWPSNATKGDTYAQQQEFINLLNTMQNAGINAVIVQVRPAADAFYESSFETWSRYITGTEGQAPMPYYDPTKFMIDECHKRGMEFHAWFNPYRALVDARKNTHPYNHVTYTHPDWFVNYGGKKYFDPGIPAVRKYVQDVVCEVVSKYDIDAVHFDDYFYPYKIGKLAFPDHKSYAMYADTFYDKGDWRRNNVNLFIAEISKKIKVIKPTVKFGISPFGIWRNMANDADGSQTNGCQNYDDLFADVLLWQRRGWIDYVMPQLYWERGHKNADFSTLLDWWHAHTYGRALYIGQGLYQMGVNEKPAWRSGAEIPEQIAAIRNTKNVNGYSLYSANGFYKNKYGIVQTLQYTTNATKAIVPPMKWLDSIAPQKPIVKTQKNGDGTWQLTLQQKSIDANYYVIYQFNKNEKIDIANAAKIEAIQNGNNYNTKQNGSMYKYVVTSLDKIHNESEYTIVE
jgi:uncharacterized lipoprotein YddW (UPF0748 family)